MPQLTPCGSKSTANERVTVLAGETDPNYQRKTESLLHNKEQYVWNTGLLGSLLVLLFPLTNFH